MRSTAFRFALAAVLVLFATLVRAANDPSPASLKQFVETQFGSHFTPDPMPGSTTVLLTGDLDGDGQEDAVIVCKSKEPLADQVRFNYRVIDPLDTYYGWGNPSDTTQFGALDPDRTRVLLVVHSWRSPEPKAKFAIINVPFTALALESVTLKKKQRPVISASEYDIMRSYLFWDGKKWKYEPGPVE
ncbi:MAG TPA: hypothetical protein VKB56_02530 [Terriglobales bacterium]|nr:hypothetical protein [Terriglobales bacterium]